MTIRKAFLVRTTITIDLSGKAADYVAFAPHIAAFNQLLSPLGIEKSHNICIPFVHSPPLFRTSVIMS
jgi:hypothetical protein